MTDLTYLSLGAGVQSSALLVLANQGKVERPSVAIFADTGDEPQYVYDYLEVLEAWSDIPIERVSAGRLSEAGTSFLRIPAFTDSDGVAAPIRRQCTQEYKITPIRRRVRALLGLRPGQRAAGVVEATAMLGISLDEVQRCKPSRDAWITNEFPLIDLRLRRDDCRRLVVEAGLPEPKKSSCVFCPYHDDAYWIGMRKADPTSWMRAVEYDRAIRDSTRAGVTRPAYLHRSLRPLDEVEFKHEKQETLWDSFSAECDGLCGV